MFPSHGGLGDHIQPNLSSDDSGGHRLKIVRYLGQPRRLLGGGQCFGENGVFPKTRFALAECRVGVRVDRRIMMRNCDKLVCDL